MFTELGVWLMSIGAVVLTCAVVPWALYSRSERREAQRRADERALLLSMGDSMGIEYVPGENLDNYRWKVVNERDRRAGNARREGKH